MRRPTMRMKVATGLLVAISFAIGPVFSGQGTFLEDPKVAFARAEDEDVPLLIDFHTTWCEACERMDRTTWQDAEVLKLLGRVVPLSVDGDRSRNLTARYDIVAYPTIVIAEPSGSPVLVVRGMQDVKAMRGHLSATLERWDVLREWALAVSGKHPDAEAVVGLADFAYSRGAWDGAERLYRKALRGEKDLPESIVARARVGLGELLAMTDRCREARKVLSRVPPTPADDLTVRRNEAALSCEDG